MSFSAYLAAAMILLTAVSASADERILQPERVDSASYTRRASRLALASTVDGLDGNEADGRTELLPWLRPHGERRLERLDFDLGGSTLWARSGVPAFPPQQAGGGASSPASAGGDESLAQKAVDPTASLMSFTFRDNVTPNYYGRSGSSNQIQFQPAIPFAAWGRPNILRITLPFQTGGVAGKGLGNVTIFNLTVFPAKGGRFGVGPVVNLASNPRLTTDHVQAGPALGYVANKGKWTYGIFNQNLFSGETQISTFQPMIAYQLGDGWAVAAGDAQWTMDWDGGRFINIPFGIQIGKISRIGKQMVRYVINPEYNAASVVGASHWTLRFGLVLLVPGG